MAQHNLVYKRSAFQTYCSEHPSAFAANNGVREPKCQNFGKNAENFARILKAVQYHFLSLGQVILVIIFIIVIILIILAIVIMLITIIIIIVIVTTTIRPGSTCYLVESLPPVVCCLYSALCKLHQTDDWHLINPIVCGLIAVSTEQGTKLLKLIFSSLAFDPWHKRGNFFWL